MRTRPKRAAVKHIGERNLTREREWIVQVIHAFASVARPIMLEHWIPNSCIAATRVTINVLGAYGIPVEPTGITATVFNKAFVELMNRLGRVPTQPEVHADGKAWAVGLGVAPTAGDDDPRWKPLPGNRPGYKGHLAALALDGALLIDGALDQASRPEKEMVIPTRVYVAETTPEFTRGEGVLVGESDKGVVLTYRRVLTPEPYFEAPDWEVSKHGRVELQIMRAMEQKGVMLR